MTNKFVIPIAVIAMGVSAQQAQAAKREKMGDVKRPNILFAIADDMSYPYMSAYGVKCVSTPNFDRVAERGQLFNNAYVTSPGSSPSRASILTGCYTWQIREAGTHGSSFPEELETYVDIMDAGGYKVGMTGKGWGPGLWEGKRYDNPAGHMYNDLLMEVPYKGINTFDYFGNFKKFMSERKDGEPFCFWYGCKEAHRSYEKDSWKKEGKRLEDAVVPNFLPDNAVVRGDVLDYCVETEWFDSHLGRMLNYLEEIGELDNTFIVVTADNGMPFPGAKATCWDAGAHVPMAICWGDKLRRDKPVDDVVSTIDLAATFLDVAGLKRGDAMVSNSLMPLLKGKSGNDIAFVAREHHADARDGGLGYPIRAIRKGNYLYLYNFEPDRWPAGDPWTYTEKGGTKKIVAGFRDIDWSPSKALLLDKKDSEQMKPYYAKMTRKRPLEELYNLENDSQCEHNLIGSKEGDRVAAKIRKQLFDKLKQTSDTRLTTPQVWDSYPYYGKKSSYPKEQY